MSPTRCPRGTCRGLRSSGSLWVRDPVSGGPRSLSSETLAGGVCERLVVCVEFPLTDGSRESRVPGDTLWGDVTQLSDGGRGVGTGRDVRTGTGLGSVTATSRLSYRPSPVDPDVDPTGVGQESEPSVKG